MEQKETLDIDTRLGKRSIDVDKIVYFPHGLAGFEEEHNFVLLQIRPEAPLLVLQSTSKPQLGLLVADPYSFLQEYPLNLGLAELALLRISNAKEAAVLVTVTIPQGEPEKATLNLTGPIIINYQAKIGIQVPQNIEGLGNINLNDLNKSKEVVTAGE